MDKTVLVAPDVELGYEVLRLIEAAKFPFSVAMWIFRDESAEWEFTIATPLYEKEGTISLYGRLLAALKPMDPHTLHQLPIRILSQRDPMIRGLRRTLAKGDSAEGKRLRGPAPGSKIWIDDSYVYRIR